MLTDLIQIKFNSNLQKMSLGECFPHATIKDGKAYFISMVAFKDLPIDSVIDLKSDERMSLSVTDIESRLVQICVPIIGYIQKDTLNVNMLNLLSNIPLEDKARLVFCASFCDDKTALLDDFCEYWIDKKPRIFKNTKVRFVKNDTVVMEMDV